MAQAEAPRRRSRPRQIDLLRAEFLDGLSATLQGIVEEAVERHVRPLREELQRHAFNQEAHISTTQRGNLTILWDRHNQNAGTLRILALAIPILSLVMPIAAVFVAFYLASNAPGKIVYVQPSPAVTSPTPSHTP